MKKAWIVGIAIALVVILAIAGVLVLSQSKTEPKSEQNVSFFDDCWAHVTGQTLVEQADGTVEVSLTAPDYVALAKQLAASGQNEIVPSAVAQLVANNPEMTKEYKFVASSSSEADIKTALKEQIAYELIAQMLMDVGG